MGKNTKFRLLESMGKVFEQSKDSLLNPMIFETLDPELKIISDYFKTSRHQSLFVALVFALNYKGDTVDLKDMIEHFNCNPMKLLEFTDDLNVLNSTGIFTSQKSSHRVRLPLSNDQFTINEKISQAILTNQPMPDVEKTAIKDVVSLLEVFYKLAEERQNGDISTYDLAFKTRRLINSNLHFPLIKKIDNFRFGIEDTYLYIYLIWRTINGSETTALTRVTEDMFDNYTLKFYYTQTFILKKNDLINQNLLEMEEAYFFNDTQLKLSDLSISWLQEMNIKLFSNEKKQNNIIKPEKIHAKTLIFNESERRQLDVLKKVLQEDNFKETQTRLQAKGMPKGITALLHGLPGTGKTETALQFAKETNREIIKVDISQSKSMWFGESEKIIKRIFTDYHSYAKDCERMPILFFNEADGIIGKRNEVNNSTVGQTENAIQNIILEELENFEGIFFATTNLVKNLDSAFERRFLFKIEFQKPDVSVKARIWKSKLPGLSAAKCEALASRFDFSGGQIDNIVRKNEIQEVIHGITVSYTNILEFCQTELLLKNRGVPIGYIKA